MDAGRGCSISGGEVSTSWSRGPVITARGVITGLAVLLLSLGTVMLAVRGDARASTETAATTAGNPSPATPAQVLNALKISNPPAELVFLVDDSTSMAQDGLYSRVQQQLLSYLQTLALEKPADQVAVITVGTEPRVIYGPGPPTADIGLPATANGGVTDFGQALSLALDLLGQSPQGIEVGGVVLLSDGQLNAPNDPLYDGYNAPGWATLHDRAAKLSLPVTGYAVPLTKKPAYIANQQRALSEVFSQIETLPNGTTDLPGALGVAGEQVVNGAVAKAVAVDSDKGVKVTWGGLPSQALNLTHPGSLDVKVTLTSQASKVPLYVTGLRLTAPGLPITVAGTLPGVELLEPGQSVTVPVKLTWEPATSGHSLGGATRRISGSLMLTAVVGSTWTAALQSAFDDMSFSPGALRGNSAQCEVVTGTGSLLWYLLALCIACLLLLTFVLYLARLSGTLALTSVESATGTVHLPPWPWCVLDTRPLIGERGRLSVWRLPLGREMRVSLYLAGKRRGTVGLYPGDRAIVVGIVIAHTPFSRHTRQDFPEY